MLTVVDEMGAGQPDSWQDAARLTVCAIFDSIDKSLQHFDEFKNSLSRHRRVVSSSGTEEKDDYLEIVLEGLSLIDSQFEGMLNSNNLFQMDQMYWAEEWKILGAIAAAAGIKNGSLAIPAGEDHPEFFEFQNIPAAASGGVFDSWMLREQITQILVRKQRDYGHHNISRFGREGLLVRCHDKIARLKNLHLVRSGQAANESLTDNYIDVIGYSVIGTMWEREWFSLELR